MRNPKRTDRSRPTPSSGPASARDGKPGAAKPAPGQAKASVTIFLAGS